MKYLLLLLPLLLFGSVKDDFDKGDLTAGVTYGKELYEQKEYLKAGDVFLNLIQLGKTGIPAFYLGTMYENGYGVKQNCDHAGYFYFLAIKDGICDGYLNIYNMYKSSKCLTSDKEKEERVYNAYIKCKNGVKK